MAFFVQKYVFPRLRYYLQLNLPRQNNRVTQKKVTPKNETAKHNSSGKTPEKTLQVLKCIETVI